MQKKVVLINPPQYTKYPQPPMGLALLGAILGIGGYNVTILDANVSGASSGYDEKLLVNSSMLSGDAVGFTAMTPTIDNTLRLARLLKHEKPQVKVMLGGAHATLLPEETLKSCPDIDVLVKGEGDNAIVEVLRNDIEGIYSSPTTVDMDSLPYLGYHLLPWEKYRPHPPHGRKLPFMAMITSRGCPYHCSYCSKAVFGSRFRAQSPKRVVGEIAYYQRRFGTKEIAFYDDVFTLDRNRAYEIAEEILRLGIKVCWTCETRANLIDKELLKHMKKAGCYSISYGIESASQKILDVVDKGITLEQNEEAVRLSREVGLQTVGYFMIGSPGETPETVRATIDFAKKLKLDYAQFAVTTPFPGTKLYELYGGENDIPWSDYVYAGLGVKTMPVFTDNMSRTEIVNWVSRAYREFYLRPSYMWRRLTEIRSLGDMKVNLNGLKMLAGM